MYPRLPATIVSVNLTRAVMTHVSMTHVSAHLGCRDTVLIASLIILLNSSGCTGQRFLTPVPVAGEMRYMTERTETQPLIRAIKRVEQRLGFRRTRNFSRRASDVAAYYRCYYSGKLELPESYEELKLIEGNSNGCPLDPAKYDIFFYPIEAVASGRTPVTSSLQKASTERLLMVVPHEDFHQSKELERLPASLKEAASTLVGFLTASEVARIQFGPDSDTYRRLSKEAELFRQKAQIVNRYEPKFSGVYAAARSRVITRQAALARKQKLFAELQVECTSISPDPRSFNKCLSVSNNAGLAFDATYTRYYPLMYEFYRTRQGGERDLKVMIATLKQALSVDSEAEAVRRVQALVDHSSRESWYLRTGGSQTPPLLAR